VGCEGTGLNRVREPIGWLGGGGQPVRGVGLGTRRLETFGH